MSWPALRQLPLPPACTRSHACHLILPLEGDGAGRHARPTPARNSWPHTAVLLQRTKRPGPLPLDPAPPDSLPPLSTLVGPFPPFLAHAPPRAGPTTPPSLALSALPLAL